MTIEERNKKILAAIEKATKRATSSKKAARAVLIKEGIYTKSGNLRSVYRNEPRKEHEAA